MDDNLISKIQDFTLEARALLERETDEQLQGIYGWLTDGKFTYAERMPAVQKLDEARETRQRLEAYCTEEQEIGISSRDARKKLVRETAFTWLNRLVAFRMLEERRLIKQTITKLHKSNGFIYWLTAEGNEDIYKTFQQGSLPQNSMGEGPSDVAYRKFLFWQCTELSRDISVLFDTTTLSSNLCPRSSILQQIAEMTNDEDLVDSWKPGNEEALGWIYEGFVLIENKEVFNKFKKGKKVRPDEIGAATQRFTPQWIVKFLVQNSLGSIWVEIHPDSQLKESLDYLVPIENTQERSIKLARDITFLDPCCGSMHFGLVAFDLLVEMYKEELQRAEEPGWPDQPSVASEQDIPTSIIQNNLHGIDIDLRAVQISVLALFLRARSLNPECEFTDHNLACANVEEITGGRLEQFIAEAKFSHPIYERILKSMALRLKDSNSLGSLVRIEKDLEHLIEEERRKARIDGQLKIPFPGITQEQFKTQKGLEEFFELLFNQIQRHLDHFVQRSRTTGRDPGIFVREAQKGLRFLYLAEQRYDVVTTNPPYMSRRNMSNIMASFLDKEYSNCKGDLYASFITRCVELARPLGKVAMVTQQSFMFITTYEKMRHDLRANISIETMNHLGPKAFPAISGEKVNTTAFVFRREPDAEKRDESVGVYFRLVRERDSESKRKAFESALDSLRSNQSHAQIFYCKKKDFDAIPGSPWTYWLNQKVRLIFKNCKLLGDLDDVKEGINTGDNTRFVRYWWEIAPKLGFDKDSEYVPFCKGAPGGRYFANINESVLNDIDQMRLVPGSAMRNLDFSFRDSIVFLSNSSTGFRSRFVPRIAKFCSTGGRAVFPNNTDLYGLLGYMNSSLCDHFINLMNPTMSIKVGDVARLPICSNGFSSISSITEQAVALAKKLVETSELSFFFKRPGLVSSKESELNNLSFTLKEIKQKIDDKIYDLFGLYKDDVLEPCDLQQGSPDEDDIEDIESETFQEANSNTISQCHAWLSYAIGVTLNRFQIDKIGGFGCGDFPDNISDGILVSDEGHHLDFAPPVIDALRLMRGEEGMNEIVKTSLGEGDPESRVRAWLDRFTGQAKDSFWKYHFQLYRKRPVYWPLQSPKRRFTIWIFHERFTTNTLFQVKTIVEERKRLLNRQIADATTRANETKATRDRRELEQLLEFHDDLTEFLKLLDGVIQRGYTPHIDDGILLNAAPLYSLLPSWKETEKAWQELEEGKYDWAQQAMEYWPERVKEKCQTNKSFAIAHRLA